MKHLLGINIKKSILFLRKKTMPTTRIIKTITTEKKLELVVIVET